MKLKNQLKDEYGIIWDYVEKLCILIYEFDTLKNELQRYNLNHCGHLNQRDEKMKKNKRCY